MKNIKKSFAATVFSLIAFVNAAFAEQPKAAEYRAVLASGRYCLEYCQVAEYADAKMQKRSDKYSKFTKEIFVSDGGKRAILSTGGRRGNETVARMETSGAVGRLFRNATQNTLPLHGELKLDLLYKNGHYYQFFGKNKALRFSEAEINDTGADPRMAWPKVQEALMAPDFFLPFIRLEHEGARYVESIAETIFGAPLTVDKYIVQSAPKDDKTEAVSYAYKYYYDEKGELRYVNIAPAEENGTQEAAGVTPRQGKRESLGVYIRIDSFTREIPADIFAYPKGYEIYYIQPGGVNDLFCYGKLVESEKDR